MIGVSLFSLKTGVKPIVLKPIVSPSGVMIAAIDEPVEELQRGNPSFVPQNTQAATGTSRFRLGHRYATCLSEALQRFRRPDIRSRLHSVLMLALT